MNEYIKVIRHDFDNMENNSPYRSEELGIFIAKDGLTAYGNASKFISGLRPVKIYSGYDGFVYPRFELVRGKLNEHT